MGLGIALKVDDGAGRAAENLMARLLHRLEVIDDATAASIGGFLESPVENRAGLEVGYTRKAADAPF